MSGDAASRRSRLGIGTSLRLTRAVIGIALLFCDCATDVRSGGGRGVDALLATRTSVARLSGQTVWQPCTAADSATIIPRAHCGSGTAAPALDQFTAMTRGLAVDSSPAALHRRAIIDLHWSASDSAGLRRAVESLEQARRATPRDAALLNDLAVAYTALAERDQTLEPMLRALDAIERSVALDSSQRSSLFNRALILERLYFVKSAENAWTRYLASERDTAWIAEARAHLRTVARQIDTTSWADVLRSPDSAYASLIARTIRAPQAARELSFPLLREWGLAVAKRDTVRAAALLRAARAIGASLDSIGGDAGVSLAVRRIEASGKSPATLGVLARAHIDLADGIALYGRTEYQQATLTLRRAEAALRLSGSPMARWAAYYWGAAEMNRGDYGAADARLAGILASAQHNEVALIGKTTWVLGVTQGRRGNYEAATRFYREATPYVARAREAESLGFVSALLAETLRLAGQTDASRTEAYVALRLLSPFRQSHFLNNHLAAVAADARAEGLAYGALTAMGEVLDVARSVGNPIVLALALCARARDLAALDRTDDARSDLDDATRWIARLESGRGGDRVRAAVILVRGQMMRKRDPRAALPILADAVAQYQKFESDAHLPTALYEAAEAARGSGEATRARPWLQQAIQDVERQQAAFQTAEARATFGETVENVFDAMVSLELESGNAESAFAYLERGRIAAWSVAERRLTQIDRRTAAADLAALRSQLPADMAFVDYALLRERLIVWVATRQMSRQFAVEVSRDTIVALTTRLTREARQAETPPHAARDRLFDLLARPLERDLEGIRRLAIVADRELNAVPFAALRNPETGKYLVERYAIRAVPTAAFLVTTLTRTASPHSRQSRALVIGNPAIDTTAPLRLASLPGADREAQRIAQLYPHAALRIGAEADARTVLELLPSSSVVHFAGHAVFNGAHPENSYLALAPSHPGDDGLLRAREIGGLRLPNVEVVVLSACSTLNPHASRTGPIAGIAYSFLRAGVPATVSTLWDVNDEATTELLVEFHRRLAAGVPAAEALRLAQLEALRSSRSEVRAPRVWAAFIYTGP